MAVVRGVYQPAADSLMRNDSGWFACHDMVNMMCYGKYGFSGEGGAADHYEHPEYLCIEYLYKNSTVLDTVFLESVAHLCKSMNLPTETVNGKFENSILWRIELMVHTAVEIKQYLFKMNK